MYLDRDNVPFYIGKGKGYRYCISTHIQKHCPNNLLKNKILKMGIDNVQVKFLHTNLSEEQARENGDWISVIKRNESDNKRKAEKEESEKETHAK